MTIKTSLKRAAASKHENDANDRGKWVEVILSKAARQAHAALLREVELMGPAVACVGSVKREAARRVLAKLRSGEWTAAPGEVDGLAVPMAWALEQFLAQTSDPPYRSREELSEAP